MHAITKSFTCFLITIVLFSSLTFGQKEQNGFDNKGMDGAKLNVFGRGEGQPLVPNDSPANRSRNRRVEIIVHQ